MITWYQICSRSKVTPVAMLLSACQETRLAAPVHKATILVLSRPATPRKNKCLRNYGTQVTHGGAQVEQNMLPQFGVDTGSGHDRSCHAPCHPKAPSCRHEAVAGSAARFQAADRLKKSKLNITPRTARSTSRRYKGVARSPGIFEFVTLFSTDAPSTVDSCAA